MRSVTEDKRVEVGDVLLPVVRTTSFTPPTAPLVIEHHAVPSPQNVPFWPQILMAKARAAMQDDDGDPPGSDLHHMKHRVPDRRRLSGSRERSDAHQQPGEKERAQPTLVVCQRSNTSLVRCSAVA